MVGCSICKEVPKLVRVLKCAACFKPVCEKCGLRKYGNLFCSQSCSVTFFFGSGEEDIGE